MANIEVTVETLEKEDGSDLHESRPQNPEVTVEIAGVENDVL